MKMKIPNEIKWIISIYIGVLVCVSIGDIGEWILLFAITGAIGYAILYALLTPLTTVEKNNLEKERLHREYQQEFTELQDAIAEIYRI